MIKLVKTNMKLLLFVLNVLLFVLINSMAFTDQKIVHNPEQNCHPFRFKVATYSGPKLPPFRLKAATF